MSALLQDIRFGLRTLRGSPGFTTVVVLSLAVGIGANTTTFSWIDAMLLRPITGAARVEELVSLQTVTAAGDSILTSYLDYRDIRDQSTSFQGLTAWVQRPLNLGDGQQTEPIWAEVVAGNFFDVLGVRAALGRTIRPEEGPDHAGGSAVAVLSYGLWERRFQRDRGVVGRKILINRQPFTVVGVAPQDFHGAFVGVTWDLWVPLSRHDQLTGREGLFPDRGWRDLQVIGRLKPGVRREQARAEVDAIARRLAEQYPDRNGGMRATVTPVWQAPYTGPSILGPLLKILLGASAVVLLIVCANVANLMLARAATRQREFSIRLGLGASRGRLIRQVLTESVLLALLGAGGGFLLSHWMTGTLVALVPPTYFRVDLSSRLDGTALGFTVAVAILAGLLFGLVPAFQITRAGLEALRDSSRRSTSGPRSQRLRQVLVMSEVALALVALVGAGLFLRSFRNASRSHPGFDSERILLTGFNLASSGYNADQGLEFYLRLRRRLEAVPGVEAVSYAMSVPLGFEGQSWEGIEVEGYVRRRDDDMRVFDNRVAPGYFDLMKIPFVEGRDFTERDDQEAPPVAIVNQAFVEKYLGGRYPLSRKLRGWGQTLTIVGVVRNSKYQRIDEGAPPYLYVPVEQFYRANDRITVHVRTSGPPPAWLAAVRREVRSVDPNVAIFAEMPLAEYIRAALLAQKTAASLLTVLGSLALLLAALGLYSVMAYAVSRRTHELGIRMALGAARGDVLRLVLRQGFVMLAGGLAAGLAGAFAVTRLAAGLLFGVSATDPLAFASSSLFLAAVTLLSCYLPARRAMNLHPAQALRYE